jgi:hypothetical protein
MAQMEFFPWLQDVLVVTSGACLALACLSWFVIMRLDRAKNKPANQGGSCSRCGTDLVGAGICPSCSAEARAAVPPSAGSSLLRFGAFAIATALTVACLLLGAVDFLYFWKG